MTRIDTTVKERWKFRKVKKYLDVINLCAGCPIYKPSTTNKFWQYHSILMMWGMNLFLASAIFGIIFNDKQNLLLFISQGNMNASKSIFNNHFF